MAHRPGRSKCRSLLPKKPEGDLRFSAAWELERQQFTHEFREQSRQARSASTIEKDQFAFPGRLEIAASMPFNRSTSSRAATGDRLRRPVT